jgi:hypothetical protein
MLRRDPFPLRLKESLTRGKPEDSSQAHLSGHQLPQILGSILYGGTATRSLTSALLISVSLSVALSLYLSLSLYLYLSLSLSLSLSPPPPFPPGVTIVSFCAKGRKVCRVLSVIDLCLH